MRLAALGAVLLCAAMLAACGGGGDDDGDGDGDGGGDVSFAQDIAPIFQTKCIFCHHSQSASGVDLTDPFGDRGVINRENTWTSSPYTVLVEPGNPDNSFLLRKVSGTDFDLEVEGGPMPVAVPAVEEADIAIVANWIDTGADVGAPYNQVLNIFGSDTSSLGIGPDQSGTRRCVWCHYPGSITRLDVSDPADPTFGLVDVDAAVGGTRVIPGDSANSVLIQKLQGAADGEQMPFNPPRLSAGEIADVTAWIEAGAPNN